MALRRSFAVLAVLAPAALAQTTSPLIPTDISTGCATFLASLDVNVGIQTCVSPFTSALQEFAPGASTQSSAVNSTLSAFCAASTSSGCSTSTVTAELSAFYAACPTELTSSPNVQVKLTYDLLYAMIPAKQALCCKDDSGNYCASEVSASSGTSSGSSQGAPQAVLQQYLSTSLTSGNATVYSPNATTYQSTNLLFLFLQPSFPSSALCKTCTRNILSPYITFMTNYPYAPGINSSVLLAGQTALYNGVINTCGESFMGGAVTAAGSLSNSLVSSAIARVGVHGLSTAASAFLAAVSFLAL